MVKRIRTDIDPTAAELCWPRIIKAVISAVFVLFITWIAGRTYCIKVRHGNRSSGIGSYKVAILNPAVPLSWEESCSLSKSRVSAEENHYSERYASLGEWLDNETCGWGFGLNDKSLTAALGFFSFYDVNINNVVQINAQLTSTSLLDRSSSFSFARGLDIRASRTESLL